MRIAVGICTWLDGDALEWAIGSTSGVADELLLCDGAIAGVERGELPILTPLGELGRFRPSRLGWGLWGSQAQKRDWLLANARELGADWLLQIDADEELHQGDRLRSVLSALLDTTASSDVFAIPFEVEPGRFVSSPWKCVRVAAWRHVVAQGCYLEHANGCTYAALTPTGRPSLLAHDLMAAGRLPWLSHHPERRPYGRRDIRLGELENDLEPPLTASDYYAGAGWLVAV